MTRRSSGSGPAAGPVAARAAAALAASRNLAGVARKTMRGQEARPPSAPAERPSPRGPEPAREGRATRDPAYAEDRLPTGGIPAGDWLAAFQHAARELFGEQWEPQLARFLAFLRRRVTGDYVVDEYGFDQEITERFFMTALRPIAQKWFRIEVRGIEDIPAEGGRWSSPTTPAPSRSTG